MIFIYEKGTNKYKGFATRVFDNGTYREATVEELFPYEDHSKLGYIIVKDSPKYAMDPRGWKFKVDENNVPIGIERIFKPKLRLSTTAPDTDKDGFPELPADGKSKAEITVSVEKVKGDKSRKKTNVLLSTTGGILSKRRLSIEKTGEKVFLTSVLETVSITVTATAEGAESAALTFELMPPE